MKGRVTMMEFVTMSQLYKRGQVSADQYTRMKGRMMLYAPLPIQQVAGIVQQAGDIVNIAEGVRDPLRWFQVEKALKLVPSAAEQLIINELTRYSVEWYREVSFEGLKVTQWGYLRYDFWLPVYNILLEYDGQMAHSTPEHVAKDALKTKFCKDHGIHLIRWDKRHYYHIEKHVRELMQKLRVI